MWGGPFASDTERAFVEAWDTYDASEELWLSTLCKPIIRDSKQFKEFVNKFKNVMYVTRKGITWAVRLHGPACTHVRPHALQTDYAHLKARIDVLNSTNPPRAPGMHLFEGWACRPSYYNINVNYTSPLQNVITVESGMQLAGAARITVTHDQIHIEELRSVVSGAGDVILSGLKRIATLEGIPLIQLISINTVMALDEQECRKLGPSALALNVYYKRAGFRDTHDACAPEWRKVPIPAGVVEGPVEREEDYMSMCVTPAPHADFVVWSRTPASAAEILVELVDAQRYRCASACVARGALNRLSGSHINGVFQALTAEPRDYEDQEQRHAYENFSGRVLGLVDFEKI